MLQTEVTHQTTEIRTEICNPLGCLGLSQKVNYVQLGGLGKTRQPVHGWAVPQCPGAVPGEEAGLGKAT